MPENQIREKLIEQVRHRKQNGKGVLPVLHSNIMQMKKNYHNCSLVTVTQYFLVILLMYKVSDTISSNTKRKTNKTLIKLNRLRLPEGFANRIIFQITQKPI